MAELVWGDPQGLSAGAVQPRVGEAAADPGRAGPLPAEGEQEVDRSPGSGMWQSALPAMDGGRLRQLCGGTRPDVRSIMPCSSTPVPPQSPATSSGSVARFGLKQNRA